MFPPEKQTSIGLIVGLGAAASAALAAFYVLYKKDDDTFELDPRLTSSSERAIKTTKIHKCIPEEYVGHLIGRNGENIKKIQNATNTKINFYQDKPGVDRVIAIKGSPSGVLEADEAIDKVIESFLATVNRKIYIDASEVGLIIGKGGSNIKLICEESGAKVNVPRNVPRSTGGRVPVEVRGELANVEKAIAMIDEKLRSRVVKGWSSEPIQTSYPFIPSRYNVNTLTTLTMFAKFEPEVDNDFVDTYVSSVQNPSKFYIQICVPNGNDLDRLMVEMTDYYEEAENRSRARLSSFVEGDIVAAKFMNDQHYYRVKIVSFENTPDMTNETEVSVFNLDFGNEAIVQKRALFILHEDFLFRLPFQAVECSLSGVLPISGSDWSEDAIDHFKKISRATLWEKILAKPVQATNVANEPRQKFTVELILCQDGISLNIAQDLIEKGFANAANAANADNAPNS